jgi:hypothetical protein
MRVLLDECLPHRLKQAIVGYDVATVSDAGWAGKSNGELLRLAVEEFDANNFAEPSRAALVGSSY